MTALAAAITSATFVACGTRLFRGDVGAVDAIFGALLMLAGASVTVRTT